ncbi:MAG: FAD-dependent monooxygenase [Vulcanococcus sp.]
MTTAPARQPAMLRARVNGCGPSGALAALALARAGWAVQLVDPLSPEQLLSRSRAYALTHSSRELLTSLGLWSALQAGLAPFHQLELCDRALHRQVRFSTADLPAASRAGADAAVGWILQHQPLMQALLEAVQRDPAISLQLGPSAPPAAAGADPQAGSVPDRPDLVVAADGHHSPTRAAAGLRGWGFAYRQGCLTVQVRLRGCAPDQAWELFRPEGPFAVLPLGGDAFQLVWSAPLPRLRQLEALDGVAFLDALSAALPEHLQAEVLLDQPRAFPVGWELAWPLQRRGLVLLGEAAHRCHPVGGQGLNLCWRDVAVLAQLARQSAGARRRFPAAALPARYARRRWLDTLLVLLATDGLVRLFSNRQPLLLPLRRLALTLLATLPPLRRLALGAMTDGPCRLWRP